MKNIVTNTTPLLSPHTGIARYIYNISYYLQKDNLYNYNYFEGFSWRQKLRREYSPLISDANTKIIKKIPYSRLITKQFQKYHFKKGISKYKIDLYHEPNYLPISFDKRTVITVHDLSFIRYPDSHPIERVRLLEKKLPLAINNCQKILVDSEFVRKEITSYYGVDPCKVVTTTLGVDNDFYIRNEKEIENEIKQLGLKYKKYILTVGTLEPRKNLFQTINAYKQLSDKTKKKLPLVIIGARGWKESKIWEEVRSLIDSGLVIFPGYINHKLLVQLYSGAKVFLYPSIYEGFGLPPLEAMASGVPVIVTNRASLPEVVGDAGIVVEVGDVDDTYEKLLNLLENGNLYSIYCDLVTKQAQKFTWEKCAKKTKEVYDQVLNT